MSWALRTTWGTRQELGDEPENNLGVKGRVRGQAGDEGEMSCAARAAGGSWSSTRGMRVKARSGRWRLETLHLHCPLLPNSPWALQRRRKPQFPSCLPAVSGPLFRTALAGAWALGTSLGRGLAWWPAEQLCGAQPQGQHRGRCAWIRALSQSAGWPTYHNGSRT